MPLPVDLTTLTDLKNYISPSMGQSTGSDAILAKIISAVSRGINRYLARTLAVGTFSEVRNGNGRAAIRTLVYPILSVQSVIVTPLLGTPGQVITPTDGGNMPALSWDDWFINLQPGWFTSVFEVGRQNITLNYTAGYITPGQLAVLSCPAWAANLAVTQSYQILVNGYLYQSINTGTTGATQPAVWGQTTNSLTLDNGVMWMCMGPALSNFPANASLAPDSIVEACMQQSALLYKNRTRVGDTGTGVGPDHVNYFLKDAHPSTISLLKPHREVFPTEGLGVK